MTSYPKKGKRSSRPGTAAKGKSEKLGNPYFYRHEMGGDEMRMREIMGNDYSKPAKPRRGERTTNGIPANPMRWDMMKGFGNL
jgi:hypothetical protein